MILDGSLNDLSFDALAIQDNNADYFSEIKYLIHQTRIKRHFSEAQLNTYRSKSSQTHVFSFSSLKSLNKGKTRLAELPSGHHEKSIIERTLDNTSVFEGKSCTKKNFIEALSTNNTNVHLASHGYANALERDQLKLYFRNADLSLDSLFAYELLPYQIKANRIILSACQSASGKTESVEGVYNWPRYLLQQGAQSVISTLWLLNDLSGSEIFKHYYQGDQDLREAKLNYLTEGKFPVHPYYWAGLVEY
jgi:CHAT domain-containing protein